MVSTHGQDSSGMDLIRSIAGLWPNRKLALGHGRCTHLSLSIFVRQRIMPDDSEVVASLFQDGMS
ncbi:MAG: hypothetical protein MUO26_15615 [Methanotrichaceae archaeon]|nr:hypothetical protein [Methanotrichaceae archaeon]